MYIDQLSDVGCIIQTSEIVSDKKGMETNQYFLYMLGVFSKHF